MTQEKECSARPHSDLLAELKNPNVPKTEREWAASREIGLLEDTLKLYRENDMFIDISKLSRQQVKEILEAAGWAWDDAKSIDGEQNRRDCEALVNEAYRRGLKAGINAKTQVAAVVAAWDADA